MKEKQIKLILLRIGCQLSYKGFKFLHEAIKLGCEGEDWLTNIRKGLYPKIAAKYNTTAENIDRDIRTLINNLDKEVISEISFGRCKSTPSVVQFLSYLTAYVEFQES